MSVLLERPGLELEAVNVRGQTAIEVAQARGHHQVKVKKGALFDIVHYQ